MSHYLSSEDKKKLEEIHRDFLQLEKISQDGKFDSKKLAILKDKILGLFSSEHPDVIRLSKLETHLTEQMTLKHFSAFAIPFERILNKNITDADFLIYTDDKNITNSETLPMVFILDNIRSAFNVGSIFRTAECLNIEKIYLCGYTSTPDQEKIEKTALGTDKFVKWDYHFKASELIDNLKSKYQIIALETTSHAKQLTDSYVKKPTAFVLGNERFGLDPEILNQCDEIRSIPIRGHKNSLNVGVATAIAGYEWYRQWKS